MAKTKRRPLTEEEIQIAERLKRIWLKKQKELGLTQLKVAGMAGWSSQSSVNQYINANIPLNTDAKLIFSKILGVSVEEIDPNFVLAPGYPTESIDKVKAAYDSLSDDDIISALQEASPRLTVETRKKIIHLLVDDM